jgi:hypothetical protein
MVWDSIPRRGKRFFCYPKRPDRLWGLLLKGYRGSFAGGKPSGVLTTYVHLAPSLRMSPAIPLLLLYALMAWAGKTLFYFTFIEKIKTIEREYCVRTVI